MENFEFRSRLELIVVIIGVIIAFATPLFVMGSGAM